MDIVLLVNADGLIHPADAADVQHFLENGWTIVEPEKKSKTVKKK